MAAYGSKYGLITGEGDISYNKKVQPTAAMTGSGDYTKRVTEPISAFNSTKNVMRGGVQKQTQLGTPSSYDPASGGYQVRSAVAKSGLDTNRLGWDGEYVSYNGVKLKPLSNVNGTTYASAADINDFISRAYKADGRTLVQANRYENPYGLQGLDWNQATKQMTVGGKPVDYAYIDENGNAWADEALLKQAYDEYAHSVGVSSPRSASDKYEQRMQAYDKMRDEIAGEKWKYTKDNLMNDLAYQAYKNQFAREAALAHDDALGQAAIRNGGALSSQAQLAAAGAYNQQMQRLNDVVPSIMEMAYNRWLDDRNAKINDIAAREAAAYNRYNAEEISNQNAYDRERQLREDALTRMYEPLNRRAAELEIENSQINAKTAQSGYEQQLKENAYSNAAGRGYFTDEEAVLLGLRRNADGSWPNPWDGEALYSLGIYNGYEKPKLMDEWAQERLAAQKEYENKLALQNNQYGWQSAISAADNQAAYERQAADNQAAYERQAADNQAAYERQAADNQAAYDRMIAEYKAKGVAYDENGNVIIPAY